MKGNDFMLDFVNFLHYKCHKINLDRGRSYIGSPNWIKKNEKTAINPINDKKCFQYLTTLP